MTPNSLFTTSLPSLPLSPAARKLHRTAMEVSTPSLPLLLHLQLNLQHRLSPQRHNMLPASQDQKCPLPLQLSRTSHLSNLLPQSSLRHPRLPPSLQLSRKPHFSNLPRLQSQGRPSRPRPLQLSQTSHLSKLPRPLRLRDPRQTSRKDLFTRRSDPPLAPMC